MNLAFIDKIQEQAKKAEGRTKEHVEKTREQLKELQTRGRDLVTKGGETLKTRADRSRRDITLAEAQALDTVGAWLERLHEATGERADWLDRGRTLMDQVASEIRLGNLTVEDLPIAGYDALGVKKIGEALKDLEPKQRELVRAYELTHKNRITVFRAVDRLNGLDEAVEEN